MTKSLALVGFLTTMGCAQLKQSFMDGWEAGQQKVSVEDVREARRRGISIDQLKDEPAWFKKNNLIRTDDRGRIIVGSESLYAQGHLQYNPDTRRWEYLVRHSGDAGATHLFQAATSGDFRFHLETLDYDVSCSQYSCSGHQKMAIALSREFLVAVAKMGPGHGARINLENQARDDYWVNVTGGMAQVALSYGK